MGVILTVISALAALVVGLVGYGKTLPATHVASRPRLLVTRIVRVLSRHVFGQTRSLDAYLTKLHAALS